MKNVSRILCGSLTALVLSTGLHISTARSEELDPIFTKVKELVTQQNYSKALDELKWASKEIEKLNAKKIETYFPDSLAGFTGQKITSSGAMGMTNIERKYDRGSDSLSVSLTNLGGGAAGGLGGFAQLGSMAAMMGGGANSGMDSVRVAGKTAQVDTTGSSPKLTVFLDGSILALEGNGKTSVDDLKKAAESLKMDELEKYLKGA